MEAVDVDGAESENKECETVTQGIHHSHSQWMQLTKLQRKEASRQETGSYTKSGKACQSKIDLGEQVAYEFLLEVKTPLTRL